MSTAIGFSKLVERKKQKKHSINGSMGSYEQVDGVEGESMTMRELVQIVLLVLLLLLGIATFGMLVWTVDNESDERDLLISNERFLPHLLPWSLGDWNSALVTFVAGTKLSVKQYIYDSVIAYNTDIIVDTGYELPTFTTVWGSPGSPIPDVGIMGTFDYDEPYSAWGGDAAGTAGITNYPLIISDFGHAHILTVHARSRMLRSNPNMDVSDLDMTLERLSGGSAFLFAKFANLVDSNGNFIPYGADPPVTKQIKGLFSMFIFGDGTSYEDGAAIPLADFNTAMTGLINGYGTSPAHKTQLLSRLNDIGIALSSVLRLSGPNPLNFVPWLPLMTAHQNDQRDGCARFTKLYFMTEGSDEYNDYAAFVDEVEEMSISMGLQMAAFFIGFEGVVNILDKLMIPPFFPGDDYAIPLAQEATVLTYTNKSQRDWWMQHVVVFRDWNLACALNDKKTMYETETAQSEGCGNLARVVGGITFYNFDTLIRRRNFYGYTDTL